MYTIKENTSNEFIIKNSKFITYLIKINNIEDIKKNLNILKNKYPDATHHCYAYKYQNIEKSEDDGEPSKTAGIPILKVINNNNLTNILVVVIRYYGGIQLGANGLIRAYTKSTTEAIKKVSILKLIPGYNINIYFNYNNINEINYLLKDIKINTKIFDTTITYNLDIETDFINTLNNNNIKYEIIKSIEIEK